MRALAVVALSVMISSAAALADAPAPVEEVRNPPSSVYVQQGYGCLVGASAGAVASAVSVGLDAGTSVAVGCLAGAAAAPAATELYNRYRVEAALFLNSHVRYAANRAISYLAYWLNPDTAEPDTAP